VGVNHFRVAVCEGASLQWTLTRLSLQLLTGIASAAAGAAALKEADAEEILRALDEVNYEKF